jgi:NTP pyrophosphatase (non-canonical NTP hydrolase)
MDKYQSFVKKTIKANYTLEYRVIGLAGEVGEVCNEIKRIKRDDLGVLRYNRLSKITDELGDVLWYYTSILNKLGLTFEDVIEINKRKLNEDIINDK